MKFLCVFASILLAVSGYRIAPQFNETNPYRIECGGWDGYIDVINPSVTGSRTIVSSSNFGKGNYADNEKCSVQIVSEDRPINVRLTFTDFNLEYGYSCSYDGLCVNGFEYCGTTLNDTVLSFDVPANSSSTIVFRSDGSITRSGFQMTVDAKPIEDNKITNYNYSDYCLEKYQEEEYPNYESDYFGFPDYTSDDYPNNEYSFEDYPNNEYSFEDYPNNEYSFEDYPNDEYSFEDYQAIEK